MSPTLRRLVYVLSFEGLGVLLATLGLAAASGDGLATTGVFALTSSAIAVAFNFLYNTGFEAWEARQSRRGRGLARRIGHALGLEAGLVVILTPLMAWWLHLDLATALALDLGMTAAFLGYAFLFNLGFDALFGLPHSARH